MGLIDSLSRSLVKTAKNRNVLVYSFQTEFSDII